MITLYVINKVINKFQNLLLTGIIVSVGLWAIPVSAQVEDEQVNALVDALRLSAPPNRPNDGMYSQWQVKPAIIPSWTSQCAEQVMTPAQFEADPTTARSVVACIIRRELEIEFRDTGNNEMMAVRRAACWWMTGQPSGCNSGPTADYVKRVLGFYQMGFDQQPQSSTPVFPQIPVFPQVEDPQVNAQDPQVNTQDPQVNTQDPQVNALVEALRLSAPPNRPNDGMYSDWQVLPAIIPSWTSQCAGQAMTPAQFEADPTTARSVVACIIRRELDIELRDTGNNEMMAVRRTACWWMTGEPSGCNSGPTADYVERVLGFYQNP
ncbi:hypothetical protein [Moorena sp. SIO3H5]|uniref:hypothetical protein n=1 Tax=Moorena sp. SIO3H5 TaxID=2607834 RepID=UPI0025F69380|nr:hypothetical protein [Moorena sp. SIO3H5]